MCVHCTAIFSGRSNMFCVRERGRTSDLIGSDQLDRRSRNTHVQVHYVYTFYLIYYKPLVASGDLKKSTSSYGKLR